MGQIFQLKEGQRFRNQYMEGITEIFKIDEPNNLVTVILPTGQLDNSWVLEHTKWAFEKGEYILIKNFVEYGTKWAFDCHKSVNQLYDNYDYSIHLKFALWVAERFIGFIPEQDRESVLVAVAGHDVIEDTRQTYNDVRMAVGKKTAELILACTSPCDERNRTAKAAAVYTKINQLQYATFVKLADRIANMAFGRFGGSEMYSKYVNELDHFIDCISGEYSVDKNQTWFKKMVKMLLTITTFNTEKFVAADFALVESVKSQYRLLIQENPKVNPDGEIVYLAGPISGNVEANRIEFERFETILTNSGYHVMNPFRICDHMPQDKTTWEAFMKTNLPELLKSRKVFMVPGWEKSDGASLEYFIAWRLLIPVYELIEDSGNIIHKKVEELSAKQWGRLIHKLTSVPLKQMGFLIDLFVKKTQTTKS